MGSGKGQTKRVNLSPIKGIKNFIETSKEYKEIKSIIVDGEKVTLNLNNQSDHSKFNKEILDFMKHNNISLGEYFEGMEASEYFEQHEIDYFKERPQAMGVCTFDRINPTTGEKYIRIAINHPEIEHEFSLQAGRLQSLHADAFPDPENDFLGSGRKLSDLLNNYRQRIILHEIGHALMGISKLRESHSYEEFKAEVFAKKVLDAFYGEEDFHSMICNSYIKINYDRRVSDATEKVALNELAHATLKASKAARKFLNEIGYKD